MNNPKGPTPSQSGFGVFCDWGIVFSTGALIFVLPASIAWLDSFAALAILFYLLKKINRIILDWPSRASDLNLLGKIHFIWKGFAPPVNFLNLPLQFLALAFFISVLFSQYPALSLFAFFGKFVKCVFLYFSFIEAFIDEKRIRIFLIFILASAFITVLSGVFQHYTGIDFIKGSAIGYQNFVPTGRISSSFFGANGFGAYLLPIFALVAHLLFTATARHKSWVLGALLALFLALLLACLCWTYSRSSWVGYIFILISMVWMDHRKIFYVLALLLVFILIFLPSLANVRHLHLINDDVQEVDSFHSFKSLFEHSGSGRFGFWKKAVSIIRSSPIHGTGLNTYAKCIERDPDRKTWWYAHNCYLQMTAETGVLGLVCFLWMAFVLLRQGLNRCRQMQEGTHHYWWRLSLLQGAVSGLFGFWVQSFFDNTFYTVQLSILMWVLIGLTVAVTRLTHHE